MLFWIIISLYIIAIIYATKKKNYSYAYDKTDCIMGTIVIGILLSALIIGISGSIYAEYASDSSWKIDKEYSYEIASIKNGNSNNGYISGNFIIFSGYIRQNMIYVVMKKYNDGSLLKTTLPAKKVRIYETNEQPPHVEWNRKTLQMKWIIPWHINIYKYSYYKLYVPENTVIKEFQILPN